MIKIKTKNGESLWLHIDYFAKTGNGRLVDCYWLTKNKNEATRIPKSECDSWVKKVKNILNFDAIDYDKIQVIETA